MKKVTKKTAMNIYTRWMTISAVQYDIIKNNLSLDDLIDADGNSGYLKLKWILKDYTNKQVQKIIYGLENNIQYEATYLKDIMVLKLKSYLREKKLNELL